MDWHGRPGLSEADLFRGFGLRAAGETVSPDPTAALEARRRPSPLRPGDHRGPLGEAVRLEPRGRGPGAPVRVVIYAPAPWAVSPWLNWLRERGWHVHVVGRAAYAHHPERRDLPGWLVGFDVDGEPRPSWLRWLSTQQTRIRSPRDREADRVIRRLEEVRAR